MQRVPEAIRNARTSVFTLHSTLEIAGDKRGRTPQNEAEYLPVTLGWGEVGKLRDAARIFPTKGKGIAYQVFSKERTQIGVPNNQRDPVKWHGRNSLFAVRNRVTQDESRFENAIDDSAHDN